MDAVQTRSARAWLPRKDSFARIAFWQFMTFLALLLAVWVNELLDLSALVYETPPRPPDLFNASILSAGVLLAAIVAVGHSYAQQKRIIRGFLTVCSYCHKIRIKHEDWEQMESFVVSRSLASFSHGVCPDCYEKITNGQDPRLGDFGPR
jgi:hypothetical protein